MLYRVLFGIDVLAALIAIGFFVVGLIDGSITSFNLSLWLGLLAAVAIVLGGAHGLRASGRPGAASGLLALLAVPTALFGVFILAAVVLQPRWN